MFEIYSPKRPKAYNFKMNTFKAETNINRKEIEKEIILEINERTQKAPPQKKGGFLGLANSFKANFTERMRDFFDDGTK